MRGIKLSGLSNNLCSVIFSNTDNYILNASKTQLLQYNLTRDIMQFYHSNKIKAYTMVAISSQYSFGADKAVQMSQAVFVDKGAQPELRHKNCKITLLIWISDLHYEWLLGFKLSEKFNIALLSMHT